MKKKIICFILVIALILPTIVGCSEKNKATENNSENSISQSPDENTSMDMDDDFEEDDEDDLETERPSYTHINQTIWLNPNSLKENGKLAFLIPDSGHADIDGDLVVTLDVPSIDFSALELDNSFNVHFGEFWTSDCDLQLPDLSFYVPELDSIISIEVGSFPEDEVTTITDDGKWCLYYNGKGDYYRAVFRLEEPVEGFNTHVLDFYLGSDVESEEDALREYEYVKESIGLYRCEKGNFLSGENMTTGEITDLSSYPFYQDVVSGLLADYGFALENASYFSETHYDSTAVVTIPYGEKKIVYTFDYPYFGVDDDELVHTFEFKGETVRISESSLGPTFSFDERDPILSVQANYSGDDLDVETHVEAFVKAFS